MVSYQINIYEGDQYIYPESPSDTVNVRNLKGSCLLLHKRVEAHSIPNKVWYISAKVNGYSDRVRISPYFMKLHPATEALERILNTVLEAINND